MGNQYNTFHLEYISLNLETVVPKRLKRKANETFEEHLIRCCNSPSTKSKATQQAIERACIFLAINAQHKHKKSNKK